EAFDEYGWNYYTKEWHEEWYPGYGSAWALYIGAVGLLYEQSGADGMPTKQRDGYIQTYREAVQHQFIGSIANLTTTAKNRTEHLRAFYQVKVDAIEAGKKESPRRFVIPNEPYPTRSARLVETLLGLGVRVERTTEDGSVRDATDIYGHKHKSLSLPAGSYVVGLDQPLRALIKGMLEFDPHFTKEFLEEERREQEKWGDSRLYEFSAWSLALAYDCGVVWTDSRVNAGTEVITSAPHLIGVFDDPAARYGWVIDYSSDKAPIAAMRLMREGYKVQAAKRPFRVDGREYPAGSLVIRRRYNDESVVQALQAIADDLAVDIHGVSSAIVQSGSDLGADSFRNLELPRIGLFGGPGVDFTSYGSLWHHMDQELGVGHSILNVDNIGFLDLERYNVLILPDFWGGRGSAKTAIGEGGARRLKDWVRDGGTLICIGGAADWATDSTVGISSVRLKRESLDKLAEYEADNAYELFQSSPTVDTNQVWHYQKPGSVETAKSAASGPDKETLKRRDTRARRLFQPRGVVFNVMLD
ncbi:MAG: hypothetical protein ACE5GA_11615, partial [Candidatus Zixiibacteriota bacterium]